MDRLDVSVTVDSEYVFKGITEWMKAWRRRGWRTSSGEPVKNDDLWKQIATLLAARSGGIRLRLVRGHSGVEGNEAADALATRGRLEAKERAA